MNMVSLVAVEDFDKYSELATVGSFNAIWGFREVVGTVSWQGQITGN
jgi:hypothetical protein